MLKWCTKAICILITSILIGTILLCFVYLIPLEPIQSHVKESIDILLDEGENPYLLDGIKGSSLDNYTDALMLMNASYESPNSFYVSAMLVERESNRQDQPIESLQAYLQQEGYGERKSYSRYWHGYLLILKPLLFFLNYGEIRFLNRLVILIMLIGLSYGFLKRKMWRGLVAFGISVISLFPITIPYSLQFSTIFYIGLSACMFLLWKYELLEKKNAIIWFFLVIGMLTSYMDYLTYPLFTFGMPIVLYLTLGQVFVVNQLKGVIQNGIFWSIGYVGMWFGKWLVGSILTRTNLFYDAMKSVTERLSHEAYNENINSLLAVFRNGYIYFNKIGIGIVIFLIIWLVIGIFKHNNAISKNTCVLLTMVAGLPILWYCITTNHSYMHYWYTFRNLAVSVFAIGMIPQVLYQEQSRRE